MRYIIPAVLSAFLLSACSTKEQKPNVLLIAVDDLNDWIGCMGGHPQAQTPNIDRLASGGVLFTNAHCQSPVCNPSRSSMMTSLYPASTGIYFLNPEIWDAPEAQLSMLMPERFKQEGYHVSGAGKLFHSGKNTNERLVPNYGGQFGAFGPIPEQKLSDFPGHPLWDWGVFPDRDEEMPDFKIAAWAAGRLAEHHDSSIWLGAGFYRPHVPQYAPQHWFDLYPMDELRLPAHIENDLGDISAYAVDITRLRHVHPPWEWVEENEAWKPLVQSYLACVSFVDAQVGRVMQALEESEYAGNTYVVFYSDHGFHLGEKERFAKRSLWQDGAGVPMIICGPGIPQGVRCDKPVQLLDIYPTLLDLCGMEADPRHEGHSMRPLLENPDADWPHYARISFGPGNCAIVSEDYRYIVYRDGSEEFYSRADDPHEWHNLAGLDRFQDAIQLHRNEVPEYWHPILGEGSTGHNSYEASYSRMESRQENLP